jgi:hypothetical protein
MFRTETFLSTGQEMLDRFIRAELAWIFCATAIYVAGLKKMLTLACE